MFLRNNLTEIFYKKGNIVLIKDILVLIYVLQKYSNGQYWASPLPKGLPSAGLKFPCKAGVLLFFCKPSGIGPMISLPLGKAPKHYTKSASWVIPTGLLQECCFATRCRGCPGTSRAPEDALFDLNGPIWAKIETFVAQECRGRSN